MSSATIALETDAGRMPRPFTGTDSASRRLNECARTLRVQVKRLQAQGGDEHPAGTWIRENHSYLQFQIRETQRDLPAAYLRKLPRIGEGAAAELRVYRLAASLLEQCDELVDAAAVEQAAQAMREDHTLQLIELWAFGSALKLVLIEKLCANLDSERVVSLMVRGLRALELVSWPKFVESVSIVERTLQRDPAGIYARMDFATRDRYRHQVETIARHSKLTELQVAEKAIALAAEAGRHTGYYLVGPGAPELHVLTAYKPAIGVRIRALVERRPSLFYISSITLGTALIVAGFRWIAGPFSPWMALALLVPASQAALEIVNALVSRLLSPRSLPSMDFSEGIPEDAKTMVVVPTLLFSAANAQRLLEDLEIRYLANREANLSFALLTDFADADSQETANDSILNGCVEGIQRLNRQYGSGGKGPFYLFHRPRQWNAAESKWMGYERKRGKLNDLNRLLLGEGDSFQTVEGEASLLREIRYVITLDTDTQLPRETAAKMVAAAAHPLNWPVVDAETGLVKSGYALMRPRVAVSMESAGRSRISQIFSGQTGFDPYATSVSDLYQDLHAQASFTGKGIYHVRAFHGAVGDRFPENAILSHDLIEGEYARTGLLTGVEVVEDYPATYEVFAKRKHRWVRGDWQLLPWLAQQAPAAHGEKVKNPLPFLSRWKMFDNLRRSLFEICVLALLAAGWLTVEHTTRWTLAVLALLQVAAYADLFLMAVSAPERRFWRAFVFNFGERIFEKHRDALLNLIFIPHQAFAMADAIVRTLFRRFVSQRNLLEWETMAQTEAGTKSQISVMERYLYLSSGAALLFLLVWTSSPYASVLAGLVCALWIAAPLAASWLDQPPPNPRALSAGDREFLRGTALRTWRFFADHSTSGHNWLVPDTVQQDPQLEAPRISPTNLGLLLTSQFAAHDFGYLNPEELSVSLGRVFDTVVKMPRNNGHFFNWYDTRTLRPEHPHFVSSVDSGNLAASLSVVRQGCLALLKAPTFGPSVLEGLRDHLLRLREELPYAARSGSLMRLAASILRQLETRPSDLFHFEAVLTDCREMLQRLHEALSRTYGRLLAQGELRHAEELQYWETLLGERMDAALGELHKLAPWLSPAVAPELRLNIRDASLAPLLADLCSVPPVGELSERYERIRTLLADRLDNCAQPLYPALRLALEELLLRLPAARSAADGLIHKLQGIAERAGWLFEEMDFRAMYDPERKLLRIGYDADSGRAEESCYDLLASEARTAVFLAIAKGEIPREAWFRLGRKLTAYRNRRTLLSWSGTMFEYLMPHLHMRSYGNTLLERGVRGAVEIQQLYASERGLPWGVSEAAYSVRDERMQYQYLAFGVPHLSARSDKTDRMVVAPYASMLALMLEPAQATANLRTLATQGCLDRYGFYEAIEYSSGQPELIRSFMAHHQGMGLLAIDNALLGEPMQARFHADPLVQATEFLLQERMPSLVEVLDESEGVAA